MNEMPIRKEFQSYNKRIMLLWSSFLLCLFAVAIITSLLSTTFSSRIALIYTSTAVQNLCVFILPALITAYCITARPAIFLEIDVKPRWQQIAFVLTVMVVSMPAMNYLIHLNEAIDLPDSAFEQWLRDTEAAARAVTDELMAVESVGMLIVSVLLIGVLTGFGEELFFRGAQQRIFLLRGINGHVAVWTTALIFSALHFQFYGFFPRLLLGAFFGYLAWKGRSLWLPVIAHAFNNSIAVILGYMAVHNPSLEWINTYGVPADGGFPMLAIVSTVVTAAVVAFWGKKVLAQNS